MSKDDISLSLKHSLNEVVQDLTDHLILEINDDGWVNEAVRSRKKWIINMKLPHLYSRGTGNLILSVSDLHSTDITSTTLEFMQEAKGGAPIFDPAPKSVSAHTGQDVFINTRARGSTPIKVSITLIVGVFYKLLRLILIKGAN